MTVRSLLFLLGLGMGLFRAAVGMEPLALLATQPVWQAGQPVTINVDYDGGLPSQRLLCRKFFFCVFCQCQHLEPWMKSPTCRTPRRQNTRLQSGDNFQYLSLQLVPLIICHYSRKLLTKGGLALH